jgi:beta-barrel assembly-enhancing protease
MTLRRAGLTGSAIRSFSLGAFALVSTACMASTQQEVQMGAQYAQQINQQLPLMRDPEVNRYITVLGDSIARVADERGLQWRFYVVDDPQINAFAVPGGFIYVNSGLIARTANMSELAGVLGHEIAHVTRRHSMDQMAKAERANLGVAALCIFQPAVCESGVGSAAIQVGGAAAFSKFSRDDERESDRYGVQYVTRAGIDPRGMPSMFRTLLNERRSRPSGVEAWFSSHPLEEDRVQITEQEIAKIDPTVLRSLTRDTPAYQRFKSRVVSLQRK